MCFRYNERNYHMDVREVKPADAACIIEADCEVRCGGVGWGGGVARCGGVGV